MNKSKNTIDWLKGAVTLEQFHKKLSEKNPEYKKAYDELEEEFQKISLTIRRRRESQNSKNS